MSTSFWQFYMAPFSRSVATVADIVTKSPKTTPRGLSVASPSQLIVIVMMSTL